MKIAAAPSLGRPLQVGLVLAGFELSWMAVAAREPLVGAGAWVRFAVASVTVGVAVACSVWIVGAAAMRLLGGTPEQADPGRRRRAAGRVGAWAGGLAASLGALTLWALTDGRRLRDLPGRVWAVAGAALVVGAAAAWSARRLVRWRCRPGGGSWLACAGFGTAGLAALVADGMVLPRLYPALHVALACAGVVCLLVGASLAPARRARARPTGVLSATLAIAVAAPWAVQTVMTSGHAAFVTERWAPVSGKVVGLLRRIRTAAPGAVPVAGAAPVAGAVPAAGADERTSGIDLSDRSVLVITIDALRADRLAAYGGSGLTPHLDRLAEGSAVFTRAYTPTPHTSYAIGSLWTGKDLRAATTLAPEDGPHATVAGRLGSYGYRTAAFHPPAIFHVDSRRFAGLAEAGLGFDHRVVEYAGAAGRAQQVARFVEGVDPERPLFLWAHLFEPHEPYDPPPAYARGDTDVARYDGEVAAADAAVGRLVATFRRHRPRGVVVVTADHGEEHGDHGGYYHGTTLYDEQARVPLLWSVPGAVAPARIEAPVELQDVGVTLLTALGVPVAPEMGGDDLGPVLAGRGSGPAHAFASVRETRMATDGRYKMMCTVGLPTCRLYDLVRDPGELRDVAGERTGRVERLRAALGRHLAGVSERRGAPEARVILDRARLGDVTSAARVATLLGDGRAAVRAEAARASGRLGHAPALPVLRRLADDDPNERVRVEAAVATLRMGEPDRREVVRAWLVAQRGGRDEASDDQASEHEASEEALVHRAALALARAGDSAAVPELAEVAGAEDRPVRQRRQVVRALGRLRASRELPLLVGLLEDPRLRIEAARALGRLGDRRAVRPLVRRLRREPHPPAREAEVEALRELGYGRAEALAARSSGSRPRR